MGLAYLAYFNAGLQIYDISDPHDPHISGYFIPDDPKERRGPIPSKLVHQAEDVLVDRRGVIYMSEGNSGIYILTLNPAQQVRVPGGLDRPGTARNPAPTEP